MNSHEHLVREVLFDKYQELLSEQIDTSANDINNEKNIIKNNKYLKLNVNENTFHDTIIEDFKEIKNDFKSQVKKSVLREKISPDRIELLKIINEYNRSKDEVDGAFSKEAKK